MSMVIPDLHYIIFDANQINHISKKTYHRDSDDTKWHVILNKATKCRYSLIHCNKI